MTRSTVKRLTKPLDEPEREFQRRKKAALRSHQNESLAIAKRNLFDNEASSTYNTRAKPPMPPKTLHEHSHSNSFVAARGEAGKGGSCMLIHDLVVMGKVGASGLGFSLLLIIESIWDYCSRNSLRYWTSISHIPFA
nr:hypothetical protein [Tanacetum cinerariifolium]